MALRIFNTIGVSTVGDVVTANQFDTIIVTRNGGLAYQGNGSFDGIASTASFVTISVQGEVYGTNGITARGNANEITVGSSGVVAGSIAGIEFTDGVINNAGDISGRTGISSSGNGKVSIFNTGVITSDDDYYGVALLGGNDSLTNAGHIRGSVFMGAGSDTYDGEGGRVTGSIELGNGDDLAEGGNYREIFLATSRDGNDVYFGGGGVDTYYAFGSESALRADLIRGIARFAATGAVDVLGGIENIRGTSFGDSILGNRSNNTLWGGAGNDALFGRDGNDLIYGGLDNDRIDGSAGDDVLVGGGSNDSMSGGDGDDLLISDGGRDVMSGGAGSDTFVFAGSLERANGTFIADQITDFRVGQDKIDLTSIDANLGVAGNQDFTWVGSAVVTAVGQVGYTRSGDETRIWAYTDDTLPLQRQMIIKVNGQLTLTASDFEL
jgi:Ca2+-binding RTX toxin-like protein